MLFLIALLIVFLAGYWFKKLDVLWRIKGVYVDLVMLCKTVDYNAKQRSTTEERWVQLDWCTLHGDPNQWNYAKA